MIENLTNKSQDFDEFEDKVKNKKDKNKNSKEIELIEDDIYKLIISNQIRAEIPGSWISNHELLEDKIEDSTHIWWGTVPLEIPITLKNNSKEIRIFDRKFIGVLINPPKDDKSQFMSDDDFFYVWKNNVINLEKYQIYKDFALHFGFELICESSADKIISRLHDIVRQTRRFV